MLLVCQIRRLNFSPVKLSCYTMAIFNQVWKTGLIRTLTEIHFLSVRESYTLALPRNAKYLTIDGQVCFHRRLFTDAFEPR